MSEEQQIEKDDWNTILGELDEIIREIHHFSRIAMGDKTAFEENYLALIHFITELKKEKKNKSWEKVELFANQVNDLVKSLDETQQIKMQNRRIDRSFIGILPKNTDELGKRTIEVLNEMPPILEIINGSVEAMLIDIKLKLGFSIMKFEKEILDIKHQIELFREELKTHIKTKKGLVSRDEQYIYTQAYREAYHELIEKAISYILRDYETHSAAFENVYERYLVKTANYRENPAFDDFIKEQCLKIEETIAGWQTEGFSVFTKAQVFIRRIDDRLSDTKQSFIQQIKADLEKEINNLTMNIEKLSSLESEIDKSNFSKMKEASEKIISAAKFLARTTDVVSTDPYDKLINDEKIVREATVMATAAYDGTYGSIEKKLDYYIKQIPPSKTSKKILDIIKSTKENCMSPNNLVDILTAIPHLIDHKKNINILLKEIATDIMNIQDKFLKKIKNINKSLGKSDIVKIPEEYDLLKIEKIELDNTKPLEKMGALLKDSLMDTAITISEFEGKISDGLGISINPNLESKLERYKRPSFKPNVKQANSAMNELERFAQDLTKDACNAIDNFSKELKNFIVRSSALKTFQELLKNIAKEASSGKVTLNQLIIRLEQAVTEYAKLLEGVLSSYNDDLKTIMKDLTRMHIYKSMSLNNFTIKHEELVNNISLESVKAQQEIPQPKLLCKNCGANIIWQKEEYNDMLGLDVLRVKCENGHEDNLIGFGEEKKKKGEVLELKCGKCNSETLIPNGIDIYSKDSLIVSTTCPKNHETSFTIKKK